MDGGREREREGGKESRDGAVSAGADLSEPSAGRMTELNVVEEDEAGLETTAVQRWSWREKNKPSALSGNLSV